VKYQNGREVSESVFQAIRYMTKVGVMTRRTWNEFFGKGTLNWKQKQLRLLIKAKVFKAHPFEDVCNTYVIGNYGLEMIQDMKWKSVYHVEPKFIKHDENIQTNTLFILNENNTLDTNVTLIDYNNLEIGLVNFLIKLNINKNILNEVMSKCTSKINASVIIYKKTLDIYNNTEFINLLSNPKFTKELLFYNLIDYK